MSRAVHSPDEPKRADPASEITALTSAAECFNTALEIWAEYEEELFETTDPGDHPKLKEWLEKIRWERIREITLELTKEFAGRLGEFHDLMGKYRSRIAELPKEQRGSIEAELRTVERELVRDGCRWFRSGALEQPRPQKILRVDVHPSVYAQRHFGREAHSRRGPPSAAASLNDGESDEPPPYVRPHAAAALLDIPNRTFYDRINAGKVPVRLAGGGRLRPRWLVPLAWVHEQQREAT